MDVFCVGMYRSGSTWQYEVVSHLVERRLGGLRLGLIQGEEYARLGPAAHGRWRVLKAHDVHPSFAAALAAGRARAVYAFRDLRDVAYSLMHKYRETFTEAVEDRDRLHLCLANDGFWTAQPHTLRQRYEELVGQPAAAVTELAAHLGLSLDGGETAAIAEEYSLESNRRRAAVLAARLRQQGMDLEAPANTHHWDAETLLHWNHIRSGAVGSWRQLATPRELAVLAGVCGSWLIARGYERDETWALPALKHLSAELEAARHALAEARAALALRTCELEGLRRLGPVALGLARRFHGLSMRLPRLAGALKRLIAPRAGRAAGSPLPAGHRAELSHV